MNAYTAGPWQVRTIDESLGSIETTKGEIVAQALEVLFDRNNGNPIRKANARLIAAAPELLEALREIAEGCMNLRPGHVDAGKNRTKAEIEEIAREAIKKATEA